MAEGFDNYMVLAVYDDVLVYTESFSCSFAYRLKEEEIPLNFHARTHARTHTHTHTKKNHTHCYRYFSD